MKKAANFLACEHAQLCDFWGNVGAGLQPRAGEAGEKNRKSDLSFFLAYSPARVGSSASKNFPEIGQAKNLCLPRIDL